MNLRALSLLVLAAGCGAAPLLLPPPFGPGSPRPARLFFPTGLAVSSAGGAAPEGTLLVANGNFNHAYDAGTVVSISASWIDSLFKRQLRCDKPLPGTFPARFPDGCDPQIPQDQFLGAVLIGNYAGPLVFDDAGTTAYTGSRDTNTLNGISVLPDGKLHCRNGADTDTDCRKGVIDLGKAAALEGPWAIVPGVARQPGQSTDQRVLFVASLIPHVDAIQNNTLFTSASVAALDMANPASLQFTMSASSRFVANGVGVGPMVFDPVRRQLLMSGCYQRFGSSNGGEPGSGKCGLAIANILRVLDVDSAQAALPRVLDLSQDIHSVETSALLLAGGDGVTAPPDTLWATVRNPDALIEINLPSAPSGVPKVRHAASLPLSPGEMVRIPRPGGSDLFAVSSTRLGAVVIYDTGTQQVVAQIERLGDTPYSLKALPAPAGTARLVTSVFGDCRLGLIEVPLDRPWDAALRARAGTCPP